MSRKFAFTFTADFSYEPRPALSHRHRELKLIMMFFFNISVRFNLTLASWKTTAVTLNWITMVPQRWWVMCLVLRRESAENRAENSWSGRKWEVGRKHKAQGTVSHHNRRLTVRALSHQPSIFAHVCMKCSRASSSCFPTAATRHRGVPVKNSLNLHSTHSVKRANNSAITQIFPLDSPSCEADDDMWKRRNIKKSAHVARVISWNLKSMKFLRKYWIVRVKKIFEIELYEKQRSTRAISRPPVYRQLIIVFTRRVLCISCGERERTINNTKRKWFLCFLFMYFPCRDFLHPTSNCCNFFSVVTRHSWRTLTKPANCEQSNSVYFCSSKRALAAFCYN